MDAEIEISIQVWNNIYYKIHKQIGNQVNLQVWNIVYDRIFERIKDPVRNQVQLLVCEIIKNLSR